MTTDAPHLAVRAVVAIYREFEQIARRSDISLAQYRLLLYLRNGPKRAGAIAAAAELAKPTVSLAINALRQKGWVASGGDSDGRASVVVITAAGHARIAALEAELTEATSAMLGGEVAEFTRVLADAYARMDATKEERLRTVEAAMLGRPLDTPAEA